MLPTAFKRLHPQPTAAGKDIDEDNILHAVGITMDRLDPKDRDEDLVMIDPYPGFAGDTDRCKLPAALEVAHRDRNFHALVFYWNGWS
jgi:hypothetical protein